MLDRLLAAAAVLLLLSGLAKLWRPRPAAVMLATLARTRRTPLAAARAAGLLESAVALLVLTAGGRAAAAVLAGTYLVLAAVAVRLVAIGRTAGRRVACGCFGSSDAPVGTAHLVLDGAAFAVAITACVLGAAPLGGLGGGLPALTAVAGGLQVVLLSWLAYLAVTELPALATARRRLASPDALEAR